jgi:ABC-type branched-subunit amino acid transport system substrate-binding protein
VLPVSPGLAGHTRGGGITREYDIHLAHIYLGPYLVPGCPQGSDIRSGTDGSEGGRKVRRLGLGSIGVTLAALSLVGAACGSSSTSSASASSTGAKGGVSSSSPSASGSSSGSSETIGISPTTITVGNVSILSGPVPGLFEGAPFGAEAFFAYQNSIGGIDGRKVVVRSADDGFSCTNNQSETQTLSTQVFAFVGNFSLYDNCGARIFQQDPGISDISEGLSPQAQALPNNFSPQPIGNSWRTGPLVWYKQHYPNAVKRVGALVSNVSSAVSNFDNWEAAAKHVGGFNIVYQREVGPLETDFTSDVLRMRDAGVQFVQQFTDIQQIGAFLNDAHQQGWHPQVVTSAGELYDNNLFKSASPGNADGAFNDQTQALYLGQDRSKVPEVNLFLTWLGRTHPGFSPDIYTVYGWASARLFTQALEAAGPNLTRTGLMDQLKGVHSFNSNGMLAPSDPASKTGPSCWLMVSVRNNQFYRYTPSNGFICNPGGTYTNPHPSG